MIFVGKTKYFFAFLSDFEMEKLIHLPRNQIICPSSCGPWLTMHVNENSLPCFTYMSDGPGITAFASETKPVLILTVNNSD